MLIGWREVGHKKGERRWSDFYVYVLIEWREDERRKERGGGCGCQIFRFMF